ncbi:hypothetical protein B4U79_18527 [Dinothrombium tinctorium]|uniref:Uncharacterized protein n=1 Tax=Dinothrombium tinctorium TaxID=1965070 RepID=A0A3S3RJU7_9ACAR|nr:hypothetical protein B4U79_18527 [Dinothrombium tinctorium]
MSISFILINVCNNLSVGGLQWAADEEVYVFVGKYYFSINVFTAKLSEGKQINYLWPEVETPINGVSKLEYWLDKEDKQPGTFRREIFFYKNSYYWVYNYTIELQNETSFRLLRNGSLIFYQREDFDELTGLLIYDCFGCNQTYEKAYLLLISKNRHLNLCSANEIFNRNESKFVLRIGYEYYKCRNVEKSLPSVRSITNIMYLRDEYYVFYATDEHFVLKTLPYKKPFKYIEVKRFLISDSACFTCDLSNIHIMHFFGFRKETVT